jgi:hypothetical protein
MTGKWLCAICAACGKIDQASAGQIQITGRGELLTLGAAASGNSFFQFPPR